MEEDHDTLVLDKMYKDHHVYLKAQLEGEFWNVVARCDKCEMHFHMPGVVFTDNNSMLFVDAELQMHAFGITDGWEEGFGFSLED